MPTQNIHVVQEVGTLEEAYEALAKLQKTLRYLLNGNLDFENLRVKGIIAETIDVDKLSAISADLGHIIAGLIESVRIIGSYIATRDGAYPRAEMSNTNNLFGAYGDAGKYVKIESSLNNLGAPMINLGFDGIETWLMQVSSGFFVYGPSSNVTFGVNNLSLGGKVQVGGGNSKLGFAGVSLVTDPDDAVTKLNVLIAYLRSMGILA